MNVEDELCANITLCVSRLLCLVNVYFMVVVVDPACLLIIQLVTELRF